MVRKKKGCSGNGSSMRKSWKPEEAHPFCRTNNELLSLKIVNKSRLS